MDFLGLHIHPVVLNVWSIGRYTVSLVDVEIFLQKIRVIVQQNKVLLLIHQKKKVNLEEVYSDTQFVSYWKEIFSKLVVILFI